MAAKKISAFQPAAVLDGSELVEVVQNGANRRATVQSISNLPGAGSPNTVPVTIYNLTETDNKVNYPGTVVVLTSDHTVSLNVPFGLSYPGRYEFIALGLGDVVPTALPGVTIESVFGYVRTAGQYASMELIMISSDPDVYILTGDGNVGT